MLGSDIDPNVLGSLFILPTVIILYKIINGKNILLNFILYAIFTISIILTGSTGMLLAFVISNLLTVILSIYKRDKKKILVLIILILGFCVLFFIVQNNFIRYLDRATSLRNVNNLHGRYSIWIERLSLFENSPMWGYGQNLNLGRFKNMASHNTYIQVLFYSGFLGLFLFIFPILKIIYRKKDEERKILFILLIAILIPIMTLDELDNRVLWNVLILSDILSHQKDIKAVLL
jgi:O-antigen ligase